MTNHTNRSTLKTEAEKAAYTAGHAAYLRGEAKLSCALTDEAEKRAWNKGWLRAFKTVALY